MRIIKRYANRKLYDTNTKQYITLDEIAGLIQQGIEIQVLDNTSGEDLTTLTLSHIILEQEKKQKGFLPRSVLNALVEAGGKPISSLRQRLESPLGFLRQVDEEIEERIQALIQRGELAEEHGKKLRDQLLDHSPLRGSTAYKNEEKLKQIIQEQGVPTNEDFQKLSDQIEALAEKINQLDNHETIG
jgi:polyhydroxyalkanoate synthesis repressor PhaR